MYNANNYISKYESISSRMQEIRDMESPRRNAMAREQIKKLEEERIAKNKPRTRPPVLVCRNQKHF